MMRVPPATISMIPAKVIQPKPRSVVAVSVAICTPRMRRAIARQSVRTADVPGADTAERRPSLPDVGKDRGAHERGRVGPQDEPTSHRVAHGRAPLLDEGAMCGIPSRELGR